MKKLFTLLIIAFGALMPYSVLGQNNIKGGTLTIDDIRYEINDDLVWQYRFLGRKFDDPYEREYYNQFMIALKKGLSDNRVNIVIDTYNHSISGFELTGYTEGQLNAIGKNQTEAGKLVTHLFRPRVEGAKSAAQVIGMFIPASSTPTFKRYTVGDKIVLNHQYDDTTGEFILKNGNKQLVDGQENKITEIIGRINFAKGLSNIPIHDLVLGYNNASRKDVENTIKKIGDLDAFYDRLINGNYTDEDEENAKVFGIFMD